MELRRFVAVVSRRAWLILFATLMVAAMTFVLSVASTRIYQATATLEINYGADPRSDAYSSLLVSERSAKTYVEQLRSARLRSAALAALGVSSSSKELQELSVGQIRDTQLIQIAWASSDPKLAQAAANKLAEVFVAEIAGRAEARFQRAKHDLDVQIAEIEKQIGDTQKSITSIGDPSDSRTASIPEFARLERVRLESMLSSYQTRYAIMLTSAENFRLSSASNSDNIYLVNPAELPRSPVRPQVMLNVLLGLISGLVLGIATAFLLEYLDDTVKGPDEIESELQLPALGVIARLRDLKNPGDALIASDGKSAVSEAYRILRTNFQFAELGSSHASVVVTSAEPSEGKSTTLANLGIVLAQAGKRVILVDSDLRRPVLHKLFGVAREPGLTDLLMGSVAEMNEALAPTMIAGLRLLPSGPLPPNPAEILASQRMTEVMRLLEGQADIVLFDSPPVLSVTDAMPLSASAGNVILVVASGHTRNSAVAQAKGALTRVNAHVLGIVLNKLDVERQSYYYYYHRYYHYYGDDGANGRGPGVTGSSKGNLSRLLSLIKLPWPGGKAHKTERARKSPNRV